jgi:glutaminyl-peptide cyclotransferase
MHDNEARQRLDLPRSFFIPRRFVLSPSGWMVVLTLGLLVVLTACSSPSTPISSSTVHSLPSSPTVSVAPATRTILALPTITVTATSTTFVPTPTIEATFAPHPFDGTHAYNTFLMGQMNLGPRHVGTPADRATGDFILAQLQAANWKTETQEFEFRGVPVRNVIGKIGEGKGPLLILGAHYDTRKLADQDKTHPDQPVPGADDGASGVAVLLELARTLDVSKLRNEVWLAFFDAEDNGEIQGCQVIRTSSCTAEQWPWSVGARYVADHLTISPEAVVIVDMIGDMDQDIYYEQNSDQALKEQIWGIAARLGYAQQFIAQEKWSMEDDHTPFLQHGIRAVDIIDFDYPYWHTTQDTADKVSPASLERVGRVLQVWLEEESH